MNHGPIVFLAALFALAASWFGLVLTPQMQLGHLQQTNTLGAAVTYPVARPGLARQGLDVYRANGCAYCHTQQAGQSGTMCEVVLAEAGTNESALVAALLRERKDLSGPQAEELLQGLPKPVVSGVTVEAADAAVKALKAAGAKAQRWVVPVGSDIARGWARRHSVAADFLFDSPVMLGSQRIGPDLANVAVRQPDIHWHLLHLYAPQVAVKGSTMAPYRFLFTRRKIERGSRSPDALALPPEFAPPPGYEIVPRPEAQALAAYLVSLRADAPLFVAPLTVAPPPETGTNAPVATPASTNAPAP